MPLSINKLQTRIKATNFFGATGIFCLLCTGCITPWNTQLPSLYAVDPRIENRRIEQFDPFALDDLGPKTYTRQRDYDQPRNKVRRSKEAEYMRGMPAPTMQQPVLPRGISNQPRRYPQAVPF